MIKEPSTLNTRFDKWAARHPKMALRQWQGASASRRSSLLKDASPEAPEPYNHTRDWYLRRTGQAKKI